VYLIKSKTASDLV